MFAGCSQQLVCWLNLCICFIKHQNTLYISRMTLIASSFHAFVDLPVRQKEQNSDTGIVSWKINTIIWIIGHFSLSDKWSSTRWWCNSRCISPHDSETFSEHYFIQLCIDRKTALSLWASSQGNSINDSVEKTNPLYKIELYSTERNSVTVFAMGIHVSPTLPISGHRNTYFSEHKNKRIYLSLL